MRKSRRLNPALFLALLLAGTAPAVPAFAADAPVSLKFATGGNPPDPSFITAYIARDAGIFARNGLSVDVSSLQGDELLTKSILSGDIDIGENGSAAGLAAIAQGAPLMMIGAGTPKVDQVLVVQPGINSVKDLVGKSYGISAPGSFSDASARLIFRMSGVDPASINILPMGGIGNRANAMAAGQLDSGGLPDYIFVQLQKRAPQLHGILVYGQVIPDFLYVVMMARTEWIQKNEDTVSRFMKSIMEAARYLHTNKAESVAIMLKVVPNSSKETLQVALDGLDAADLFGVDGAISKSSFDYTVDQLIQMKALKRPLTYAETVATKPVDMALSQIGPFKKP